MSIYSELVDRILETDDYVSILHETKNYNVKTFEEFVKNLKELDARFNKAGVETKLNVDPNNNSLTWVVNRGYMGDKNGYLSVKSVDNGQVKCDPMMKFRVPGSTNLNKMVDANQILKLIDGYLYSFERNSGKQDDEKEKDPKDNFKDEDPDKNFKLDPGVEKVLSKLKTEGEGLIQKFKSIPPLKYNGKEYKIDKGTLMASTEKELIAALEFPRADEIDIYSNDKSGRELRKAIENHFKKNGVSGKTPEFRFDMDKSPYFYVSVGKLPVKQTKGPEARAILNYYDGNKVRFQPKER